MGEAAIIRISRIPALGPSVACACIVRPLPCATKSTLPRLLTVRVLRGGMAALFFCPRRRTQFTVAFRPRLGASMHCKYRGNIAVPVFLNHSQVLVGRGETCIDRQMSY